MGAHVIGVSFIGCSSKPKKFSSTQIKVNMLPVSKYELLVDLRRIEKKMAQYWGICGQIKTFAN